MSLCEALGIDATVCEPGKQALSAQHRALIFERARGRCKQSMNLDAHLTRLNGNRGQKWDYLLLTNQIVAVEVHPFDETALKTKKQETQAALEKIRYGNATRIESWVALITSDIRTDLAARLYAQHRIRVSRTYTA
jgi:hypothetical protein